MAQKGATIQPRPIHVAASRPTSGAAGGRNERLSDPRVQAPVLASSRNERLADSRSQRFVPADHSRIERLTDPRVQAPVPAGGRIERLADFRIPAAVPAAGRDERLADPQIQVPMLLKLEINKQRMTLSPAVSNLTKALMINKQITWTTAATVKRIAEAFSAIDPLLLDLVENELKCHLKCSGELWSGDVILWSESFLSDEVAYERGHKFLTHWFNSLQTPTPRDGAQPLRFDDHLKNFEKHGKEVIVKSELADLPDPEASDKDWAAYAEKYHASDLDRLMIEEAAKAEGAMRMVFDEASGQVISLAEYGRRVRVGRLNDSGGQIVVCETEHSSEIDLDRSIVIYNDSGAGKRKADAMRVEGENEPADKKNKLV